MPRHWRNARRQRRTGMRKATWRAWPRHWTSGGKLRFWLGDTAASEEVLERAIACARQSGNHRAQMRASHWLAVTFVVLPIPADDAVARAEQLLQEASGDLWAEADLLKPLCVLYAYVGRAADARAAV